MKNLIQYFIALNIAVLASGCASPTSRFYTLSIEAKAEGPPARHCSVSVGPVQVPAEVDHAPITLQVSPNCLEENEFNRWAEPLDENIARVVAGNLAAQLGSTQVVAGPAANFKPDYQVTLHIQHFKSVLGRVAEVEALWVVWPVAGGRPESGHTLATEPVSGKTYEDLVAAHSRALVKVSSAIAAEIEHFDQLAHGLNPAPIHDN